MNIYEDLKMRLQSVAFHEEELCSLSAAEVLLVLAIIDDSESMYGVNRTLRNLITCLEDRIQSLKMKGFDEPEDFLPFSEVDDDK